MKYTVSWSPSAERDLTEMWLNHPDLRLQITAAADSIDSLLRTAPQERGESRFGTVRILIVSPLVVDFQVTADDLRVEVLSVGLPRRKR
ncbi:MAG: type II toxin-antitoxin system RelE/ParE family toxin [Planctomycetota bacterium]